ncbi:GAF and ANTAR domain-containing protein [Microbacterium invictum]|uniref:GAF and ANTAR domain-containing protein n=1 Tax=Microbacterium invictum TaxID=515415 RepID=A0ABZ0VDK6_9MICO|nr:GAF and ANTAR domain-containing protein [Microbacterium invictum]WQB71209.1 GAF and ANTAR domain-containing protein [Microbacterium invictum]
MTTSPSQGPRSDAFAAAAARLKAATEPTDDLCAPFVGVTGVAGAALSTLGRLLGSQTVCASNAVAARIDEIQIDLGEGPCWEALSTRHPVLENDLQRTGGSSWPVAREAFRSLRIGALFAFPMHVGDLSVGSVDLFSHTARQLPPSLVDDVAALADIAAHQVLRRVLHDLDGTEEGMSEGPYSRREMHQASGMIAAQLRIRVDDALVVLRAHAFASGRSVRSVASDVIARRVTFDHPPRDLQS